MIKALLEGIIPKYSRRRLAAHLAVYAAKRPWRICERLNRKNLLLFREFEKFEAFCGICGHRGFLYFDMPDLRLRREHGIALFRETLQCVSCGSTLRQRTLAHVFMKMLRDHYGLSGSTLREMIGVNEILSFWDTDAFSPISSIVSSGRDSVLSKYVPSRPFGIELSPKTFNIDLQNISFSSDRYDVILSSDVMEHVRDDNSAHKEIFRCLKPGGSYVFTVPYNEDKARTVHLVQTSSARDLFLDRPHFHGDPISGGILAYRIYGRELINQLESIGFVVHFHWIDLPSEGIIDGDCFVATKPARQ
jgi:SAM-dependent methyltransferase